MADLPTQGPRAGSIYPVESRTYHDPHTGAKVRQLTDHPGADDYGWGYDLSGWYDDGRRLFFESNRDPTATTGDPASGSEPPTDDVFSIDLETEVITRITDIEGWSIGKKVAIAREDRSMFFLLDDEIVRLDLESLAVQEIMCEASEGHILKSFDVNADESRMYVTEAEPLEVPENEDPRAWRLDEVPLMRVLSVPLDGGQADVVFEGGGRWGTHLHASPTRPELFMHPIQGHWREIEDKLWVHNAETGERWSIRSTPGIGGVGHQSWQANGERVNYHAWDEDGNGFFGHARYDGTDHVETHVPAEIAAGGAHAHALGPDAFVTDGTIGRPTPVTDTHRAVPWLLYYRWNEAKGDYDGPRKLATLDWSAHPHPRITPDGSWVQFNAAQGCSSSIYLVDIPEFEDLPEYRHE